MAAEARAHRGWGAEHWATLGGLLLVVALGTLDASWAEERVISSTPVLAPFLVSLWAGPRATALVGAAALTVCTLSPLWHHNFGEVDWLVRVAVVAVGTTFAVLVSRGRVRLDADRVRFRLLSAVAEVADGRPSAQETTERLGDLLVPTLADVALIDVTRDGGHVRVSVAAHGPDAAAIVEGMRRRDPGARENAMPRAELRLVERVDADLLAALSSSAEERAFLDGLGARSAIVLPLRVADRAIGTLVLITTRVSGRAYDAEDAEFARVLSGRVALALDNAGLSSELESLEAQTAAALGNLAEAVTMQRRDGRLVYANDAAARALGFPDAASLLATPPQEIIDAYTSFHEDGRPLQLQDLPGRRVLAGEDAGPVLIRAIHRRTGDERWRIVKATAVRDREGRPRLAVNVIEDVTEVKRAEAAQRLLADAGAVLSSSLDTAVTLAQVARIAVPSLADWCAVTMPDERGRLRQVAVAHADPGRERLARELNERWPGHVDDPGGAAQVLRDGRALVVNEVTDEMLGEAIDDPEQLAAVRELGMRACMLVPMVAPGGVTGVISFISAESGRTFSPADQELAEELGRRAGTAAENARLYTERSQIARTLQVGLLPDELPEIPGLRLASLYRPAGEESLVGGDFYDAFVTPAGPMIVVGDVTGRGTDAASLTAQARHTLRTAGTLLGDPLAAVERLNHELAGRRVLQICTVAVVLLREAGDAEIVCAGHPPPVLVRRGEARQVGESGPVVGAWADSTWAVTTCDLAPGDLLVLHTDGVLDALGADGRFGEERMVAALAGARDAADAVARTQAALDAFEEGEQADDTAVLAVQRLVTPAAAPVGEGGTPPVKTGS